MSTTVPASDTATSGPSGAPDAPGPRHATPWLMTAPGVVLFLVMLVTPLVLTAVLAFGVFDHNLGTMADGVTLSNFVAIVTDPYYYAILWRTFWIALVVTFFSVVIGVPEAYILSRMRNPWRSILLVVVLAPLLVSVVVRAFGWSILLGNGGLVNQLLQALGFEEVKLLYTNTAIIIGLVHVMLPFMIIPVWTTLQKIDPSAADAALSLNASFFTTLRRIVLPQMTPGILSGSLIVFGLSASSFAIPGLLGGRRLKMVATLVYDEYLNTLNWPLGAALAIVLLLANLLIMLSYNRLLEQRYRKRLG
ncbi:ABC transporter permease [Cupriavidus plantarum]|uniref:ABC transporter permease n=1 Tax=Cupriavidus plantarum TaxID=942865 RepID=UPI000E24AE0F|nr:ABC transporter permease [Cupriavidus plantarum]REE87669.1 putative spermidine/putrescine transport system permease protein [Cupriavidus plantarum]RLK30103.1 putative spermidine/putrescine transport system permease protein [Cupriavidus plantarum]